MKYLSVIYDSATDDYAMTVLPTEAAVASQVKRSISGDEPMPQFFSIEVDDDGNPSLTPVSLDRSKARTIPEPVEEIPLMVGGVEVGAVRKAPERKLPVRETRRVYLDRQAAERAAREPERVIDTAPRDLTADPQGGV